MLNIIEEELDDFSKKTKIETGRKKYLDRLDSQIIKLLNKQNEDYFETNESDAETLVKDQSTIEEELKDADSSDDGSSQDKGDIYKIQIPKRASNSNS